MVWNTTMSRRRRMKMMRNWVLSITWRRVFPVVRFFVGWNCKGLPFHCHIPSISSYSCGIASCSSLSRPPFFPVLTCQSIGVAMIAWAPWMKINDEFQKEKQKVQAKVFQTKMTKKRNVETPRKECLIVFFSADGFADGIWFQSEVCRLEFRWRHGWY